MSLLIKPLLKSRCPIRANYNILGHIGLRIELNLQATFEVGMNLFHRFDVDYKFPVDPKKVSWIHSIVHLFQGMIHRVLVP